MGTLDKIYTKEIEAVEEATNGILSCLCETLQRFVRQEVQHWVFLAYTWGQEAERRRTAEWRAKCQQLGQRVASLEAERVELLKRLPK